MLHDIFFTPSTFTLFLAPPGSGKTTMLIDLFTTTNISIIYISPLRALAEEFFNRLKKYNHIHFIKNYKSRIKTINDFMASNHSMLISTPELMDFKLFDNIHLSHRKLVFVLDEFHLFYYWGESFRPILWEICMAMANIGFPILGLTATMDEIILQKWKTDFLLGSNTLYLLDFQNQTLKNRPERIIYFPAIFKNMFERRIIHEISKNNDQTYLIFCKYRNQVQEWLNWCKQNDISALGCVGGESSQFIIDLSTTPRPKCIFATSTLSHGVNLPSITKVFINYHVEQLDFLIQMVGRGGRNGEKYEVLICNHLLISKFKAFIELVKAIIFDNLILKHFY